MDITQLQEQANQFLMQGQYGDAVMLYQQCLDANPQLANYWYLGLSLLLQGEESEAQATWLSALMEKAPEEVDHCLAELLELLKTEAGRQLHLGNGILAERIYWQLVELDSEQSAEIFYNLGITIALRGNFGEAIACWQRAVELQPDFADAYQQQGYVFQKQEEFEQAISCYLKALEINPNWAETHYNLGLCFVQQNRWSEAIAHFQEAIKLKPDDAQTYGDCGKAFLEQGKIDEAILYFQTAIQLKSSFAEAYGSQINVFTYANKIDEKDSVKVTFLNTLQAKKKLQNIYQVFGDVLLAVGKVDLAILAYKKALTSQPNSATIYLHLGQALTRTGAWQSAIAAYNNAVEIDPHSEQTYLYLGQALVQIGEVEGAIAAYQTALNLNVQISEVYLYLGNVLAGQGRLEEAIAFYQKYLTVKPDSAEGHCNLGSVLALQGNFEQAIHCFQRAMVINSEISGLVSDRLTAFGQLENWGEAIAPNTLPPHLLPTEPPREFYESTWDWAVVHHLTASNYISIHAPSQIHLTSPKTLDKSLHFSFRFEPQINLPETFVAVIPEGKFWLDTVQSQTAIITSNNRFLADISPDFPVLSPGHPDKHPSKHCIFSVKKLPLLHQIDGTVAVFAGLLNDLYFHWMFDVLPRIELLKLSGTELASIDKFLVNTHSLLPFQKETLDHLEIPSEKRLTDARSSHLQASTLVVPSFVGAIAWMPKWSCDFLKTTFLKQPSSPHSEKMEYIYISRKTATNRRVLNEDALINLLHQFGFKSVTLESMSVVEQAKLMAGAKAVIAPHGSGLTNLVFCNPGTKVIEIFSPNYVYPCYWLVSNLVKLDYYYLLGESLPGFYFHQLIYPSPRIEDIFVDLNSLLDVMRLAKIV